MKLLHYIKQNCFEIMRFLFVGGLATILDLVLFKAGLFILPENVIICFIIAFALAMVCRFYADKFFTFKGKTGNHGKQFVAYVLSCLATLGIGVLIFKLFLWNGVPIFWSKVLSIPFVTAAGYFLFKFMVFKKSKVHAG